jgi:hypothetical protein
VQLSASTEKSKPTYIQKSVHAAENEITRGDTEKYNISIHLLTLFIMGRANCGWAAGFYR